ncbi:hypothetical protein [Spirosoma sp.]|uniref:hypothetical protein n=1 Tax=Spirosoma sp. TaxID=1899569 RepID=UPI00262D5254|nr:hypothetical protein [Spirosoma sp.]MCX6217648.1 hypothetical protein [Spirosoma sp.]
MSVIIEITTKLSNAIPVVWDRYTVTDDGFYVVYGWIARPDGQRDFVIFEMWDYEKPENVFCTTSSAKYSRLIGEVLYGSSDDHNDCRKIEELFTESILVPQQEVARPTPMPLPTDQPALPVEKMSQEDLDTLMGTFIGDRHEVGTLPTFELLWSFFLAHSPDAETVYSFFEEVEELGYHVKEEVEHPYAKEWAGSHTGITENGTPYHMTCSKEFAESPEMKELQKAIDKAAADDESI